MIDLHMHTTCSDGQFSPEETMRMAHEAGVTVAAVTDHDTASGISRARAAAEQYGMTFFSGIEISVQGEKELHILGYGIQPENAALQAFCKRHAADRRERCGKCWSICTGMACRLHWTMSAAAMTERLPADRILHGHWWNWATPPRCRTLLKNI